MCFVFVFTTDTLTYAFNQMVYNLIRGDGSRFEKWQKWATTIVFWYVLYL